MKLVTFAVGVALLLPVSCSRAESDHVSERVTCPTCGGSGTLAYKSVVGGDYLLVPDKDGNLKNVGTGHLQDLGETGPCTECRGRGYIVR
jgi:DnaJ-class molecular chaperone